MAIPGNAICGKSNLNSSIKEQVKPMRQLNAKISANGKFVANCWQSSIKISGNMNAELTANILVNMVTGFLAAYIKYLQCVESKLVIPIKRNK